MTVLDDCHGRELQRNEVRKAALTCLVEAGWRRILLEYFACGGIKNTSRRRGQVI